MGSDNRFNKGSRKRNNRSNGGKKPNSVSTRVKVENDLNLNCGICEKPIRELISAIAYGADGAPAHFDCVLKKLREENDLKDTERLQYLGNGTFGIVETKRTESDSPLNIEIKKKIVVENKDAKPEWRKIIKESAIRIER